MLNLDTQSEFGQRVRQRLQQEEVIWLVTVHPDGTPQPSPVWFLWEEEADKNDSILIYSKPGTPKLRNIDQNPRVSLHFDGNERGENIVIFAGDAVEDETAPAANELPPYVEMYRAGLGRLGMSAERFAQTYSAAIRVTLTLVRGH